MYNITFCDKKIKKSFPLQMFAFPGIEAGQNLATFFWDKNYNSQCASSVNFIK